MVSQWIQMPKGIVNKVRYSHYGAIGQFGWKDEVFAGKNIGKVTPVPYEVIIDNGGVVVIYKWILQTV